MDPIVRQIYLHILKHGKPITEPEPPQNGCHRFWLGKLPFRILKPKGVECTVWRCTSEKDKGWIDTKSNWWKPSVTNQKEKGPNSKMV